jgi:hypothetical protein
LGQHGTGEALGVSKAPLKRPVNPYVALLLAILLPGVGHVAIGQPQRGLVFAFFALALAILTSLASSPDASFVGRHAGGFFVWALSIPDAYRRARMAWVLHQQKAVGSF